MAEQIHDPDYGGGFAAPNAGFGRIMDRVAATFAAIHRVQFSAPWQKRQHA